MRRVAGVFRLAHHLLRFDLRQQRTPRFVGRLLLVDRLLLVAPPCGAPSPNRNSMKPPPILERSAYAVAHRRARAAARIDRRRSRWVRRVGALRSPRRGEVRRRHRRRRQATQETFFWTSTYSVLFRRGAPERRLARHQLKSKPHRFGKQKPRFDSPRRRSPAFCLVAFIFGERGAAWLIVGVRPSPRACERVPA